jgi:hypothetical protein
MSEQDSRWRLVSVNGLTEIEAIAEHGHQSFSARFLTVQFEFNWGVLPYRADWADVYGALSADTVWEPTNTGLLFGDWHDSPCPYLVNQ